MRLLVMFIALASFTTPAPASPRYSQVGTVSGQPEVKDNITNLIWQGCAMGYSGGNCATGGDSSMNWQNALAACANLSWGVGTNVWRLPNYKELQTIVDEVVRVPAIDSTNFPNTPSQYFWSSSTYAPNIQQAWLLYFGEGIMTNGSKGNTVSVRCVRSGS